MGLLINYRDPAKEHLGMGGGTGTETPTNTTPGLDLAQMYMEWAASNPNATLEQAFSAGADIALGKNSPIGMGMQDDFSQMPYDPSMQPDVLSGVDTFSEIAPMPEPQGEFNQAATPSWRDTVIDISGIQPGGPQG